MEDRRLSKHFSQHVVLNVFTVTHCLTLLITRLPPSPTKMQTPRGQKFLFLSLTKYLVPATMPGK